MVDSQNVPWVFTQNQLDSDMYFPQKENLMLKTTQFSPCTLISNNQTSQST